MAIGLRSTTDQPTDHSTTSSPSHGIALHRSTPATLVGSIGPLEDATWNDIIRLVFGRFPTEPAARRQLASIPRLPEAVGVAALAQVMAARVQEFSDPGEVSQHLGRGRVWGLSETSGNTG